MRLIKEDFEKWNTGRWIHYSKQPFVTINLKSFYQDPLGIFCFPENFQPATHMWLNMPYKFVLTLKSGIKILDLSVISDKQIDDFAVVTNCKTGFEDYIKQYPPKDHNQKIRMFWECMRNSMILLNSGNGRAKWNNIFRSFGWDAIFDDTKSIHSSEIQLLILDPTCIAHIDMMKNNKSGFQDMKKVVNDVVKLCSRYGSVSVDGPKKQSQSSWGRDGKPKILKAEIRVEKSKENYATLVVSYDHTNENQKGKISVYLRWSSPSLGYGVGADFDIHNQEYDRFSNLDRLKLDLDKVFKEAVDESFELSEKLPSDVVKAFEELGKLQRGEPEQAMLNVQEIMGGGVLSRLVEHVGDITHRMSHLARYKNALGLEKIVKTLDWLSSGYGFEREFRENIISNARYRRVDAKELTDQIKAALKHYASAHAKLPVYNKAQWLARQAAINVGLEKFSDAKICLQLLLQMCPNQEAFTEKAFEYTRNSDGSLQQYSRP